MLKTLASNIFQPSPRFETSLKVKERWRNRVLQIHLTYIPFCLVSKVKLHYMQEVCCSKPTWSLEFVIHNKSRTCFFTTEILFYMFIKSEW